MKIEVEGNRIWIVREKQFEPVEIYFSHVQEWDDHPHKKPKGNTDE